MGMEVPADAAVAPKYVETVKDNMKAKLRSEENISIHEKTKTLIQQGDFVNLLIEEQSDASWRSYIYDLPVGTMKFILNSSMDTLPTKSNLRKWGKTSKMFVIYALKIRKKPSITFSQIVAKA